MRFVQFMSKVRPLADRDGVESAENLRNNFIWTEPEFEIDFNRILGIDSWASLKSYKFGLSKHAVGWCDAWS
jgi:hypothetical protein